MAETVPSAAASSEGGGGGESLKDQGNEFFKAGNYLKAAAIYTQAIKKDPSNATLYSNRAAAFLHLVKLNKALADAEMTITLNPQWDKGYFRKGCILEAMERDDDAIAAFQIALQHNPQSTEVSKKIKRLAQLAKDKKRVQEVENIRSNIDMGKHLDPLKSELSEKYGADEGSKEIFSFIVETMEMAIKSWHETAKVDARVYFLLDKEKTQTDKYAPVVNIDKAFESPHTHSNCFSFLRQYAEESFSRAACLVVPKNIISYPQVWKGQGSRKWKHGQSDGFFVQLELPCLRKLWFIPSSTEKGRTLCRNPELLDVSVHEVLPRLFKEIASNTNMLQRGGRSQSPLKAKAVH
ncbi:Tetratricopeptide TPR-1 [Macleaya cordata]|uniref:Tetratricopeptide TPR-1 n=1 Tax=Macleaya cordata TaxID=56857 RepID=A0A200QYK1_MACCD|nr:Tetratricopeptide TPR-1 [Macleaya cordata]